jgi:hypothetical protein
MWPAFPWGNGFDDAPFPAQQIWPSRVRGKLADTAHLVAGVKRMRFSVGARTVRLKDIP